MSRADFDVAVAGGGMVGAAAAGLLLREGFSVALIDDAEAAGFDETQPVGLRVSAISPGSGSVLAHAGAWRLVEARRHCPYRRMHVEEWPEGEGKPAELEFSAAEFGLERLGTIVENDLMLDSLWQVLQARRTAGDEVTFFRPDALESFEAGDEAVEIRLESGQGLRASLLIGADGIRSRVRELCGIEQKVWAYGQRGLVGVVRAARPNPGVAWQRFMEGGPLAFLPLADGSSSIVWTRPDIEAGRLLKLDDGAFMAELEAASGGWLGAIESCGPRAAFDLSMRLSDRYAAPRTVLMGDAAHVVHPLAGQGVNLGFLDAAALTELLQAGREREADWRRPSVLEPLLERYHRWRKSDGEVMARGIHAIRALFTPPALKPLRRLGLAAVARSWPTREAFLRRAAGLHADAPELARRSQ